MHIRYLIIPDEEIQVTAVRARGAGGQNVNKVSSAIHLRFDITNSSLPQMIKQRLLRTKDSRINRDGVIVIKSQQTRSQQRNREIALLRLQEIIESVMVVRKKRVPTSPSKRSRHKRMDQKSRRGDVKKSRRRPGIQD